MNCDTKKLNLAKITFLMMLLTFFIGFTGRYSTYADTTAITIEDIDYDMLTMEVARNGNSIVYYSTDKTNWYEVEGEIDSDDNYVMDISWVSSSSDTTLYFKGDEVTTYTSVTLPEKNTSIKVSFDKVDGTLTFTNADEGEVFQWRKSTDYNWHTVAIDELTTPTGATSYASFLKTLEKFRVKGAKIVVRLPQTAGTSNEDTGSRPSKEVTVSITARATAPSIAVNITKLTVNTTTSMEYSLDEGDTWTACTKTMSVSDIAPKVLYENGGNDVTVYIRTAETDTKPYSQTCELTIPGQKTAPTVGDSSKDVSYYYLNGYLILNFTNASTTNIYEYAIVKSGVEYSSSTVSWKTVKKTSNIKIAPKTAPTGSTIYFRKRGTAANTTKKIALVLPTACSTLSVSFPTS